MGYGEVRRRAEERKALRRALRIDRLTEEIERRERLARFDDLLEEWSAAKAAALEQISAAPDWFSPEVTTTREWHDLLDSIRLTSDTAQFDLERLRNKIQEYKQRLSGPATSYTALIEAALHWDLPGLPGTWGTPDVDPPSHFKSSVHGGLDFFALERQEEERKLKEQADMAVTPLRESVYFERVEASLSSLMSIRSRM